MRRNATALIGIALVAFYLACSADAPAPTSNNGGGGGPRTTPTATALQVRLFTTNANPTAGNCTLIQAIVTLNGANVPDGTGVAFSSDFGFFQQNGNVVVSVTTQGGAALTALCSANPGLANVRATASVGSQTGTGTLAISFQPSAQAGPFFSSCSPSFASNAGGTTLTLNGGRFFGTTATTRATFTAAGVTREALVTGVTDSTVTVLTPAFPEAQSPSVPVTINLTFGTNTSSPVVLTVPNCFAFGTASSTTPSITAILPASGSNNGLTRVTIVGSGFSAPLQVFFGPVEAQVVSISFNQIIVLTPPAFGAGSPNLNATVDVRVHEVTSGVDAVLTGAFRFVTPVQITAIDNNQQRVDLPFSQVTIHGNGFESPVAVSLAGIAATVISVSATEIIVLPGSPSITNCADLTGPVVVTNVNTGDSNSNATFRYLVAQAAPIITNVSPGSGPPGTSINITGSNFFGIVSVTLGGRSVGFTVAPGGGSITVTAPDLGNTPPVCTGTNPAGTQQNTGGALDVVVSSSLGCTGRSTQGFQPTLGCTIAPTPTP